MVERRLEQAAKVVPIPLGRLFPTRLYRLRPVGVLWRGARQGGVVPIPLLWRGARQGGVVEPRLGGYGHPALTPHTGHPVHKQAAEMNPGWIHSELALGPVNAIQAESEGSGLL